MIEGAVADFRQRPQIVAINMLMPARARALLPAFLCPNWFICFVTNVFL